MLRRETSKLTRQKRNAQWTGGSCVALAGLSAFFRSVAIPPFNGDGIAAILAVLGIAAAAAGFLTSVLTFRVQTTQGLVEEVTQLLGDGPICLGLLDEIEDIGGERAPWSSESLRTAVGHWTGACHQELGTIADLTRQVGSTDFVRLLISRALELGLVRQEFENLPGDRHRVVYRRIVPE
jgi:hypothetical protein